MAQTNGRLVIDQPDFRKYAPEWLSGPGHTRMLVAVCADLIDGRWESFISIEKTVNCEEM